jgi:hypothetical protein
VIPHTFNIISDYLYIGVHTHVWTLKWLPNVDMMAVTRNDTGRSMDTYMGR